MSKCRLCFSVTGHEADYALTFGGDERILKVCRYCHEDLILLGFQASQVIRLEVSKPSYAVPYALVVLGPVYSLLRKT